MDKKAINKKIWKISNSSSLTLLIFVAVTQMMSFIIYRLSDISFHLSKNINVMAQGIFIYLILIPALLLIFYKTRGKRTELRLQDCFAKPQRSFGLWHENYQV